VGIIAVVTIVTENKIAVFWYLLLTETVTGWGGNIRLT
jgi:hypothetical protein